MAVKIRLKRMGKIRTPFYRVIVTDARNKRNGRAIEEIGTYNPKTEPSLVHIESERAQYWLGVGAQPSEAVAALLKLTGDWQRFKGEAAPEPLKVAAPKRDKAEIFNEALKDAHGEPRTEAVTAKKAEPATAEPARSEATKTEATPSEPATSEPAASDAESKTGAEESAAATQDGGSQGAAAASESAGD